MLIVNQQLDIDLTREAEQNRVGSAAPRHFTACTRNSHLQKRQQFQAILLFDD